MVVNKLWYKNLLRGRVVIELSEYMRIDETVVVIVYPACRKRGGEGGKGNGGLSSVTEQR